MGNYSKDPQTAYAEAIQKGYTGVRFQQGKPILDRELNLLADLSAPHRLAQQYIGNGVPDGSDGFRILKFDLTSDNFTIQAGRILVNGYEVELATDTTYKDQPHKEHVAPLPFTDIIGAWIYLRVFNVEVNETQDPDLQNSGDIGFETALRERVEWEVLVSTTQINQPDHCPLASFFSFGKKAEWTDLRVQGLTLAKVRVEVANAGEAASIANARLDLITDAATGTLLKDKITTTQIQDLSVTESKLADSSVTEPKLANLSVSRDKLQKDSVANEKILSGAVDEMKLADDSVSKDKLQNNAVTNAKIFTGAVDEFKLAKPSVDNDHIKNGVISGKDKIAPGTITMDRLSLTLLMDSIITVNPNSNSGALLVHPITMAGDRFLLYSMVAGGGLGGGVTWSEFVAITARWITFTNTGFGSASVHIKVYQLN